MPPLEASSSKRKRSDSLGGSKSNVLPTDILSSLEQSDRKAAKLRKTKISTDILPKSHAAKSQLVIQAHLLECRILLQKALSSVSAADRSMTTVVKDQGPMDKLLSKLIQARNKLCSSTLFYDNDDDHVDDREKEMQLSRHNQDYETLKSFWKQTFNKHHSNLSLHQNSTAKQNGSSSHNNKFKVIDTSFWSQVESNVQHAQLFLETEQPNHQEKSSSSNFDDVKLYQHLLQDYITLSTNHNMVHMNDENFAENNNALSMAQRLKLQERARRKDGSGNVLLDGRVSKGRKIKYVVHDKLLNFTFPIKRPLAVMGEDILFKSMLGGCVMGK